MQQANVVIINTGVYVILQNLYLQFFTDSLDRSGLLYTLHNMWHNWLWNGFNFV